jgi:RNA polymerase sigma factor
VERVLFKRSQEEALESKVGRVQGGDVRLRNQLIEDYRPFIATIVSRFCKRYIDPSRDDEFSIALGAFNEALNQFSADHQSSFLNFSETVIRRRLIDYVRKEKKFQSQIPFTSFDREGDEGEQLDNPVEVEQAVEFYEEHRKSEDRQGEIIEFNEQLHRFGISMKDLVNGSPKHADSRYMLFHIGKRLGEDSYLMSLLFTKKTLPIKELLQITDVARKTLERHRKYIIAVALIHFVPYPHLLEYVQVPDPHGKEV